MRAWIKRQYRAFRDYWSIENTWPVFLVQEQMRLEEEIIKLRNELRDNGSA